MSTQHTVTPSVNQKAQRHWKAGTQHAKAGQWAAASKAFDQALKLAPHEALYALNLARALLRQGRLREAGDAAERAFRSVLPEDHAPARPRRPGGAGRHRRLGADLGQLLALRVSELGRQVLRRRADDGHGRHFGAAGACSGCGAAP